MQLSEAHLTAARKQVDSQAASFAAGNTDRLALTQARADYQASGIAHLDALVAAHQAAGALEDAIQRPLIPDVANTTVTEQEIRR